MDNLTSPLLPSPTPRQLEMFGVIAFGMLLLGLAGSLGFGYLVCSRLISTPARSLSQRIRGHLEKAMLGQPFWENLTRGFKLWVWIWIHAIGLGMALACVAVPLKFILH